MGGGRTESRVLIEDDRLHIGFHGKGKTSYPEDVVIPAVFRAVAQHAGIDLHTEGIFWGDYCFFAGVTGEAFRFVEFMNLAGRDDARPPHERYGHDPFPGPYRRALDAAGLEAVLYRRPLPDRGELLRDITASLRDRGTPVIGFGVFGPPEPFLVTGYDDDGKVLLGWSHVQGEATGGGNLVFEPSGQFRLTDWYDAIDGVGIVTGTRPPRDRRELFLEVLRLATLELGAVVDGVGLEAMERWAAHLKRDDAVRDLSDEELQRAYTDHSTTAGDLAERRALAGSFMELCRRTIPEAADELGRAQAAFQCMHDTVYEIWETVARTGPFDADIAKFRDRGRRRTLARLVRHLAAADRCALAHLTRAVEAAGDPCAPAGDAGAPGAWSGAATPCDDPGIIGTFRLRRAVPPADQSPYEWAPENIALPNAMTMLRSFLGEPFGELGDAERSSRKLDYVLWMGLTGAAFGTNHDRPERSNVQLAMEVLGYDCDLWLSRQIAAEGRLPGRTWGWDDNLRRRILWNLRDRRLPVLLFNCGPWPDWWLVTEVENWHALRGYGGSDLGYRPNEPFDHPNNPLRAIDLCEWMVGRETWALNVAGKRRAGKPPLAEAYRRAIAWGAERMASPRIDLFDASGNPRTSVEPYDEWAALLRSDAHFPAGEPETLKNRRELLECCELALAERRFYGAGFLDLAAVRLERPELRSAAGSFRAIHDLMQETWTIVGGLNNQDAWRSYEDSSKRSRMADLVLRIGREDEKARSILGGA